MGEDTRQELLELFASYGTTDGGHHKMWVIDQAVRILTDCPLVEREFESFLKLGEPPMKYTATVLGESEAYLAWVRDYEAGEEGPHTYSWDTGIAP